VKKCDVIRVPEGDSEREIPRPAGENAGLRDDASVVYSLIVYSLSWVSLLWVGDRFSSIGVARYFRAALSAMPDGTDFPVFDLLEFPQDA
jgi:hypothetical protein